MSLKQHGHFATNGFVFPLFKHTLINHSNRQSWRALLAAAILKRVMDGYKYTIWTYLATASWHQAVLLTKVIINKLPRHSHEDNFTSSPSAAYMRWWTGSVLVKVMALCLSGAKPLHKPMLPYHQLDPWEQTSVNFKSKWKTFHSRKCLWNYCLRKGNHFVQGKIS